VALKPNGGENLFTANMRKLDEIQQMETVSLRLLGHDSFILCIDAHVGERGATRYTGQYGASFSKRDVCCLCLLPCLQ